jgi:hypothetical protein
MTPLLPVDQKAAKPDPLANLNSRERKLVEETLRDYPALSSRKRSRY